MISIKEKIKEVEEICETNMKAITPLHRGYVQEIVDKVPGVIKAIIVFGSSIGIGNTNPNSDIDLVMVVDNVIDRHINNKEIQEYINGLEFKRIDMVFEDYDGLVNAMGRGNALNQFYKDLWEKGLTVYYSEELIRRKYNG